MEQTKGNILGRIDWWTVLLYAGLAFMGWLAICGASYSYVETDYTEFLNPDVRTGRQAMWMGVSVLAGAVLPLEGLSVEDGELTYHGKKWDGMSGSDQLKVATAIVRALNPECGFVLLDKLEQMDLQTMQTFGQWLETQNLQAIATRVSTGSECTIIIEDGHVAGEVLPEIPAANSGWKAGVF